ncbi:hypothetical protein ALC60_14518 [Trachymyrmex zeteki]|uniref:Uncharacterized protein n=1 Tax=Mycetomoellerius zeteki TaxID=64791 RepID=A0A151WF24_9HYME|nr:hypothetical protein ALC60_14518 [Trachymyrmex zeteki]
MQRTLDVILTIANFKSARGERKREGNENTRNSTVRAKTKQSSTSENPGIVVLNKGRKAREYDGLSEREQMDG